MNAISPVILLSGLCQTLQPGQIPPRSAPIEWWMPRRPDWLKPIDRLDRAGPSTNEFPSRGLLSGRRPEKKDSATLRMPGLIQSGWRDNPGASGAPSQARPIAGDPLRPQVTLIDSEESEGRPVSTGGRWTLLGGASGAGGANALAFGVRARVLGTMRARLSGELLYESAMVSRGTGRVINRLDLQRLTMFGVFGAQARFGAPLRRGLEAYAAVGAGYYFLNDNEYTMPFADGVSIDHTDYNTTRRAVFFRGGLLIGQHLVLEIGYHPVQRYRDMSFGGLISLIGYRF